MLGGPVIPHSPEGVLYFFEAGWHTDDGTGVRGVKFAAYSDELTAGNGALRLVPGSHHPEQNARLSAYSKRRVPASVAGFATYQAGFPGYVAATSPGPHDVHRGLLGVEELVAARWTIWADWFFHGWHCWRSIKISASFHHDSRRDKSSTDTARNTIR